MMQKKNCCLEQKNGGCYIIVCDVTCIAGEGFDPPSFGLWAQRAASAPSRF